MNRIEALAEAWASIDGKLERFRDDKAGKLDELDGTFEGYMTEAKEMIERLERRGFTIIPHPSTLGSSTSESPGG